MNLIEPRKVVYFFCDDLTKDPVALHVWNAVQHLVEATPSGDEIDGRPVLVARNQNGTEFHLVRTSDVLSHDYSRYLPQVCQLYGAFDFAGLINWHEGSNAPDRVLTVHTTGDLPSGQFGPADPLFTRHLMLAMERNRRGLGLESFSVVFEGTHWSGVVYGGDPASIATLKVPLVDIEIGSSPSAWSTPEAAAVLARSLFDAFAPIPEPPVKSLLCVGGIHVEPAFRAAVLESDPDRPLAVSHILPNQWLDGYDTDEGELRFRACADTIRGGIDAIVFHDNLRGSVKARLRTLGDSLGIPAFKHQRLRRLSELPLWSGQ
jgi:D-tyrosyl-tRNA(Tyr) deacylase